VILTGVPGEISDVEKVQQSKRKNISPPNQKQLQRAMKFQRAGEDASPALRIRNICSKPKSPPSGGILSSPAMGRIKKCRRRISTPKRSYTPDKNQMLITSVFSPRHRVVSDQVVDEWKKE